MFYLGMVTLEEVMPRLAAADFRTTVEYTGPLEHQYLMTHFREDYLSLWLDMRRLLATTGIIRPFFKSRQVWKYVDLVRQATPKPGRWPPSGLRRGDPYPPPCSRTRLADLI